MRKIRETRGRKRKFNPSIPAHIDQNKIPGNCYWDNGKSKHWYTTYKDERGKQRRKRIAGPDVRLSDLHRIIEESSGVERNTFRAPLLIEDYCPIFST